MMYKKCPLCIGLLCLLLLAFPGEGKIAAAEEEKEEVKLDQCQKRTQDELAFEQRLYRAVVFGQVPATGATVGNIRYDTDGDPWIKTDENEWKTIVEKKKEKPNTDAKMEDTAEFPQRRGIFETKRMMTSELVPYLTQSMRTMQCRSEAVCAAVMNSLKQEGEAPVDITVQTVGCVAMKKQTYPVCHFVQGQERSTSEARMRTYCDNISVHLLRREGDLLRLAVEYDAAYRSMLQFSGNFDLFLQELKWPLTNTLRTVAGLIGQMNRIPCFLSSCMDSAQEPEEYQPSARQ